MADAFYAHPTAVVDEGAKIGEGTRIWHFCHVMPGAVIGPGCVVGQGCFIGNVRIGSGVRIQNHVSVYDGVTVEDDAFLGPSCVFTNVVNPRSEVSRKHEFRETHVGRGASIGANATIVCGATLGEYCFVAAGAVVRGDVRAHQIVAGVPAAPIGWMCRCGESLRPAQQLTIVQCGDCGREYELMDDALTPRLSTPRRG